MRDRQPLYNPLTPPPKTSYLKIGFIIVGICAAVAGLIITLEIASGNGY